VGSSPISVATQKPMKYDFMGFTVLLTIHPVYISSATTSSPWEHTLASAQQKHEDKHVGHEQGRIEPR